jgi:predicted peroxiredoxin
MQKIILTLVMVFSLGLSANETKKQNMIVHLTKGTNDLRASVMSFRLAKLFQEKGASVTMFLDQDGGRWADPKQTLDLTWGSTKIEDLILGYQKAGGKILVCPVCLDESGIDKKNLRSGFISGSIDSIAEAFLNADKILDY